MYLAAMYLVFDPAIFLNVVKGLLVSGLIVIVGFALLGAVGFGKIQRALIMVGLGAIAYMALTGTLLQDAANWFKSSGLG